MTRLPRQKACPSCLGIVLAGAAIGAVGSLFIVGWIGLWLSGGALWTR